LTLIDKYGRPVNGLRVSITNLCNYNCIFCHREGVFNEDEYELNRSDWRFLFETAVELGIRSFKITGGEPFLRKDIVDIIRDIVELGGLVSIVTNGSLLDNYVDKLVDIGIDHINISLHSLNPKTYRELTGGDLDKILLNIDRLIENNIRVKINYVVLKQNIEEYMDLIKYAVIREIDLNIIELIPLGIDYSLWSSIHVPINPIIDYLERVSNGKYIRDFQSRPVYRVGNIEITVIKGFCNKELCSKCTRLRMTPSGYLKTCLFTQATINSRKYILNRDKNGLMNAFKEAVEKREPFFK